MTAGARVTPEVRAAMLRAYADGKRQVEIAAAFGVSQAMVSRVVGLRRSERIAAASPCRFCGAMPS